MLSIGGVVLPGKLVLSPMAGVTDAPFRYIASQCGADYTISEMITSQVSLWDTDKTQRRLQDKWQTGPRIIQIAGASPDVVVEAALKCEEIGADIIEINMGCPAKKVCNVLAGSALLKDESLVGQILSQTVHAVSIPVTLKTRLGWDSNNRNILTIARITEDVGIQSLTIHGRTRTDFYTGNATYDLIAEVKQCASIPVFANGDITTPEIAKYVLEYTGVDGIYIGRGALGKPWLFRQIKDYLAHGEYAKVMDTYYVRDLILNHLKYIYEHYDEYMGCRIARKHVKWYMQNLFSDLEYVQQNFAVFSQLQTSCEQLEYIGQLI
jgi:tRNA-dihydrouridine synthase B